MREDIIRRARRLDHAVAVALAAFNEMPGRLSDLQPAERALRLRALDAAIEVLADAEERRRRLRWQQVADRQAYAELLARLRTSSAAHPRTPPEDTLTGLRPGASARVVIHLDHASPQELASLSALVRSLPEGAVEVERPAPRRTSVALRRTRAAHHSPVALAISPAAAVAVPPLPPALPPAAG